MSHNSLVIEITGASEKVEGFIELMKPYGIIEMARTGRVSLERGLYLEKKEKSSMIKLSVNILRNEDLSYPIYIGRGILKVLEDEINRLSPTSLVVITDSNVYKLHWKSFEGKLEKIGIPYYLIVIPSGEKYKNRDTKEFIENRMLEDGIDRKGVVVALGGGVIGDIAGFVAATYHRG